MNSIGFPVSTILVFLVLAGGAFAFDAYSARKHHELSLSQAIWRSLAYIAIGGLFGLYVWAAHGTDAGSRFFAGFLMEKALSVDNLMVFAAVFAYFGVPSTQQRRILQYGIGGAVVFRFIFLAGGIGLFLALGSVTEMIFGALVCWSAYALLTAGDDEKDQDFEARWYVKAVKSYWPISNRHDRFFVDYGPTSKTYVTQAFLCLLTIEMSDIMFSFDSVPAVIGITQDPLLIYTSVIFAVLGLRALYFVLEALRSSLMHLDKAVAVILLFIGGKLMAHALYGAHIGPLVNVVVVMGLLMIGVMASLLDKPEAAQA